MIFGSSRKKMSSSHSMAYLKKNGPTILLLELNYLDSNIVIFTYVCIKQQNLVN